MKKIVWTVVITLLVVVLIPFIVIASGAINMAASNRPGAFEKWMATLAVQRSMAIRAPTESSDLLDKPAAITDGLEHYKAMCVRCHAGPGVEPSEFAQGLNPPAPKLTDLGAKLSDGELFWIIKHGIRMTGTPAFGGTHSDEDVWKIAAAVKHLPNLSPEQKERLADGEDSGHGHGHGEGHEHGDSAGEN